MRTVLSFTVAQPSVGSFRLFLHVLWRHALANVAEARTGLNRLKTNVFRSRPEGSAGRITGRYGRPPGRTGGGIRLWPAVIDAAERA